MMQTRPDHGLTLTEVLISLAVAGILAGLAVPSFTETVARTRLDGALNGLSVDLQYARSEAIRRRTTSTLAVADGGQSYSVSYALTTGGDPVNLKTVVMPEDVRLTATGPVVFDALRGIAPSRTFVGTSSKTGAQLQVNTNANGRVQMCAPDGTFKGYDPC